MKKRLLAGVLALAVLLALLPLSVGAAEAVPEGWTPIYNMEDLLKDETYYHGKNLILMNDIDASKESYGMYTGSGDAPVTCSHNLSEDMVFDGNGHTIYNLKTGIWRYNSGTVRNLNVSIHDTQEDGKHLSDYGGAMYVGNVNYFGIAQVNTGTIENCNVTMKIDLQDQYKQYIGGISITNDGTIRDCIANLNVDLTVTGYLSGTQLGGVSMYSHGENALIDHCLVMGHFTSSGPQSHGASFSGLTSLGKTARCINSAFAMDKVELSCQVEYYLAAGFENWLGYAGAENCRVADEIPYKYIATNNDPGNSHAAINESGYLPAGPGCFLDSRVNILKDWDLTDIPTETPLRDIPVRTAETADSRPEEPAASSVPSAPSQSGETAALPNDFIGGIASFHYAASDGNQHEHSFYYNDNFFYGYDSGYTYQPDLSLASLCLELSAFTHPYSLNWNNDLAAGDLSRAQNVAELYGTLGFSNAEFRDYDKALTDGEDKVAYSMAVKHIQNSYGETDTLIAVPIRGGGYGAEWGSNFYLTEAGLDNRIPHMGFWKAATGVWTGLNDYVARLESQGLIQGELKLWITGYSRGAATANLLAHTVMQRKTLGSVAVDRKNLYAYTFATPAGASVRWMERTGEADDPNVFNIVSPVDIVPYVAPAAWGYTRYGVTLSLPYTNGENYLDSFRELSGLSDAQAIPMSQRAVAVDTVRTLTEETIYDSSAYYQILQNTLINFGRYKLGAYPYGKTDGEIRDEAVMKTLGSKLFGDLMSLGEGHYPEWYLVRLEKGGLRTVGDFYDSTSDREVLISSKRSSLDRLQVELRDQLDRLMSGYSGGSSSGEARISETVAGLVVSLPKDQDCTLTVSGGDGDSADVRVYAYGDALEAEEAAAYSGCVLDGGVVFSIPGSGEKEPSARREKDGSLIEADPRGPRFHGAGTSGSTALTGEPLLCLCVRT